MDEFALISRFFDRQPVGPGVLTGIGDDGAVLQPAAGLEQVQVIDTLVEGVHFPADTDAADIGYRVVVVNLSDIAAMGARPRWMTLALTLSRQDKRWVADFADGLFAAAAEYHVDLVGGDTTRGDAVVATVQVTGEVPQGAALLRSRAQVGDTIFVSGTLGDAAAGLELHGRGKQDVFLIGRFLRPSARIETGRKLVGIATAAIDVSDGLVGDLKKLLDASGVAGELDIGHVPLSEAIRSHFDDHECTRFALTGGDDYELCFTAAAEAVGDIAGVTAIGKVSAGTGLICRRDGVIVEYEDSGYRHFQ